MTPSTATGARAEPVAVPRVVGAQARELARIRVSFDRPVVQNDPHDPGDALQPAHYLLTAVSAPAVGASVIDVALATDAAVDLLADVSLSPGASYQVDVVGIGGASADGTAPANGSARFIGFVPPRPAGRVFELYRFLPELNRREDTTGDLQRFLACLQEVTDLLCVEIDHFTDLLDPDLAPDPILDLMLGELGDPFAFDLSVVDKRRLLNVLVAMYREKGTAQGIVNAIRFFLGLDVQITSYAGGALFLGESQLGEDWVLGPSTSAAALSFEVVSPRLLTLEERHRLRQIIGYLKPAHTHFARLIEPVPPEAIDHVELGISELAESWVLHAYGK
ncbi:MAG TPA: phage tail protein [Kofleriaceae bacterium]|nr:phage tail protein [Kofleriaceae bacterium]